MATACTPTVSAADFLPDKPTLGRLMKAAAFCRGCELYCNATQTVFGEGSARAELMFIGEQPGDQEDKLGRPFVGPAGRLLNQVLEEVGIDRKRIYLTNAVKHFKFTPRGSRRVHAKPNARELAACQPWLEAEVQVVRPKAIVCLGATAAQTLLGRTFRITRQRGVIHKHAWTDWLMATLHPSALLRMPDRSARKRARADFVGDLQKVALHLQEIGAA